MHSDLYPRGRRRSAKVLSLRGRPPILSPVKTWLLPWLGPGACGAYTPFGEPTPERIGSRPVTIAAREGEQLQRSTDAGSSSAVGSAAHTAHARCLCIDMCGTVQVVVARTHGSRYTSSGTPVPPPPVQQQSNAAQRGSAQAGGAASVGSQRRRTSWYTFGVLMVPLLPVYP
jgi:hypothetical protein